MTSYAERLKNSVKDLSSSSSTTPKPSTSSANTEESTGQPNLSTPYESSPSSTSSVNGTSQFSPSNNDGIEDEEETPASSIHGLSISEAQDEVGHADSSQHVPSNFVPPVSKPPSVNVWAVRKEQMANQATSQPTLANEAKANGNSQSSTSTSFSAISEMAKPKFGTGSGINRKDPRVEKPVTYQKNQSFKTRGSALAFGVVGSSQAMPRQGNSPRYNSNVLPSPSDNASWPSPATVSEQLQPHAAPSLIGREGHSVSSSSTENGHQDGAETKKGKKCEHGFRTARLSRADFTFSPFFSLKLNGLPFKLTSQSSRQRCRHCATTKRKEMWRNAVLIDRLFLACLGVAKHQRSSQKAWVENR